MHYVIFFQLNYNMCKCNHTLILQNYLCELKELHEISFKVSHALVDQKNHFINFVIKKIFSNITHKVILQHIQSATSIERKHSICCTKNTHNVSKNGKIIEKSKKFCIRNTCTVASAGRIDCRQSECAKVSSISIRSLANLLDCMWLLLFSVVSIGYRFDSIEHYTDVRGQNVYSYRFVQLFPDVYILCGSIFACNFIAIKIYQIRQYEFCCIRGMQIPL